MISAVPMNPALNYSFEPKLFHLKESFDFVPSSPPKVKKLPEVSQCQVVYELYILRHDATAISIAKDYSVQIGDALRKVLNGLPEFLYVVISDSINNSLLIQWKIEPQACWFGIFRQIMAKGFQESLICELAKVGNGEFNKHLHKSMQLSIVNEGYKVAVRLGNALVSENPALKDRLLGIQYQDRFDPENVEALFHVCDAQKGRALRGINVIGAHFRGKEVSKMYDFLEVVKGFCPFGTIQKATMIPSMKGKSQYKGWSLYIETPSPEHVEWIKSCCITSYYEKCQIFTAVDRFNQFRADSP